MSEKIACEIIEDLLPLYIDKLTSKVTNHKIKQHLNECESCSKAMRHMSEPASKETFVSKKEIDFLKKIRTRMKGVFLSSAFMAIAAVVLIIFAVFFSKGYFIKVNIGCDTVAYDISVNGNSLTLSAFAADEGLTVKSAHFSDNGGVVTVSFKVVKKSIFSKDILEKTFTSNTDIKEVWLSGSKASWYGNRIVWVSGSKDISAVTAAVFNTVHPYVGDMSANNNTACALNLSTHFGSYTNELQTAKEPYGWKIIFSENFALRKDDNTGELLKMYAYVLLAATGNLGEVSFEYMVNSKVHLLTVTEWEASEFALENIKNIGKDVVKLQALLEKTGLVNNYYVTPFLSRQTDSLQINVANLIGSDFSVDSAQREEDGASFFSGSSLSGISMSCYLGGKLYTTIGGENADNLLIKKGQILSFSLLPADFGLKEWSGKETISLQFTLYDKNHNEYTVEQNVNITASSNRIYTLRLLGSADTGYTAAQ
ncbi:MAG TPA: DUF4825 domain-containing protein [Oscillospiraceae bacterium]|nr:DUF4825 domain-containing protein [Oscillospiraceae bacterium]